jgi:hypothetical protein
MRVLVACEFSNTVRDAFLRRGHDAYSCDLRRADFPNPNYKRHIRGDVRPLLEERWDLVIAHPPCTYLSILGWLRIDPKLPSHLTSRWKGLEAGCKFFLDCLQANARYICVENPLMHKRGRRIIKVHYSQIIEPYMFGDPYRKRTCLWLKNLPKLVPTKIVSPKQSLVNVGRFNGNPIDGISSNSKDRARTFQGIAEAMADQWGGLDSN